MNPPQTKSGKIQHSSKINATISLERSKVLITYFGREEKVNSLYC